MTARVQENISIQSLVKTKSAPFPLVKKIVDFVCRIFQSIKNFLFTASVVKKFDKAFSFSTIFAPSFVTADGEKVSTKLVRLRTDMEPDDCMNLMNTALEVDKAYTKSGVLPKIDLIVSEGNEELLSQKIDACQNILCRMVVDGIIQKEVLDCFTFYKVKDRETEKNKVKGFQGICDVTKRYLNDEGTALKKAYFSSEALAEETLYQRDQKTREALKSADHQLTVYELSFAPVDSLVEHYENDPEEAKEVVFAGYGSFNFGQTINRLKKDGESEEQVAKRLVNVLHSFSKTYDCEAFLASRFNEKTVDGKTEIIEFNKLGMNTSPDIFAPLLQKNTAPLQQMIVDMYQPWNKATMVKMEEYFAGFKKEGDLPGGEALIQELKARIDKDGTGFTLQDAKELYPKYIRARADKEEAENKRTSRKIDIKLKVWHSIYVNNGVQGTISDLMTSATMSRPDLILNPASIHMNRTLEFKRKGGRFDTIFTEKKGTDCAVESQLDGKNEPGLKIANFKVWIHDFLERIGTPQYTPSLDPARISKA